MILMVETRASRPALPAPLASGVACRARWHLADIDDEAVPVGPVDGNRETDVVLVLVEGDTTNLDHLDMSVGGQVEVGRLGLIRGSPLDGVLVSALLDAEFREVGDDPFFDIAGVEQPRSTDLQASGVIR